MSLIIPMIASIASAVLIAVMRIGNGHGNSGDARIREAKERGDVATARLIRSVHVSADHRGGEDMVNRAKYSYTVDGREYTCKIDMVTRPPKTVEICYDRNRGNRYIEPGKQSLGDKLVALVPILVLVVTFLLLNR